MMTDEQKAAVERVLAKLDKAGPPLDKDNQHAKMTPLDYQYLSDDQREAIGRVWEYLKDELSSVSREAIEKKSAAWRYYKVAGPRYKPDENFYRDALKRARDGYKDLAEKAADSVSPEQREAAGEMLVEYQKEIDELERWVNRRPVEIDRIASLAVSAQFDAGAFDAAMIFSETEEGRQHPKLAQFIYEVRRGLVKRPKAGEGRRLMTDIRNRTLAHAVWMLERHGVKAGKAANSAKACGCDIVAEIYDDLLANDVEGVIAKTKGGEITGSSMRDIWFKDPDVKIWREWQSCLPD